MTTTAPPELLATEARQSRFRTVQRQVDEYLDADWNALRDAIVGRRLPGALSSMQARYLAAYLRGASIAEAAAAADWHGQPAVLHREVCQHVGGFLIEDEQRRRADARPQAPAPEVATALRSSAPRRAAGSSGRPGGRRARPTATSTASGDDGPSWPRPHRRPAAYLASGAMV